MSTVTERLDRALVRRGLARSRAEAQALIGAGQILVAGELAVKPSLPVPEDASIEVQGERLPYVSRAGLKLEAALDAFAIPVVGRTALDVGASTGGFTDCLLQRGARRVVAVDVGHGQMAPALAVGPRVTLREGVNARFLSPADFDGPFGVIVADLSFISLSLVLPALASLLHQNGDCVCLVKPQFEVGAGKLGKGGLVRDAGERERAVARVAESARAQGWEERGRIVSPIVGGAGNVEYLLWLRRQAGTTGTGGE